MKLKLNSQNFEVHPLPKPKPKSDAGAGKRKSRECSGEGTEGLKLGTTAGEKQKKNKKKKAFESYRTALIISSRHVRCERVIRWSNAKGNTVFDPSPALYSHCCRAVRCQIVEMAQNIYDDQAFFKEYIQLPRQVRIGGALFILFGNVLRGTPLETLSPFILSLDVCSRDMSREQHLQIPPKEANSPLTNR